MIDTGRTGRFDPITVRTPYGAPYTAPLNRTVCVRCQTTGTVRDERTLKQGSAAINAVQTSEIAATVRCVHCAWPFESKSKRKGVKRGKNGRKRAMRAKIE